MSFVKTALALASATLLASCGGGATPADNAQAFGAEMRVRAQAASVSAVAATAASTVSPIDAAEQLLNFGEAQAQFKAFFPVQASTQTLSPFRYRFYPASGVYLGVVVEANPTYTLNGVYVMGGPFGNEPMFVGLLTDFITPTLPDSGPGPNAANNGCYDMSIAETAGTRRQFNYTVVAAGQTSTAEYDELIGGLVEFEGAQRRERSIKVTATQPGLATPSVTDIKFYFLKTGAAEITEYGQISTIETSMNTAGVSSSSKTVSKRVSSPPHVDRQYALAQGESLTRTQTGVTTGTTTTTITAPPLPPKTTTTTTGPTTLTGTDTIKYVGRATVTVPAGTFSTCHYQQVNAVSPNVTLNSWTIVGNGIMVRAQSSDGTYDVKANWVKFNGQTLN